MSGPVALYELGRAESLRRLGSVPFGRVVFTRRALPAIRPVNHVLLDGRIIICSHEGAAIVGATGASGGALVAYEADDINPAGRTGLSVVVTGLAKIVDDPEEAARCKAALHPWLAGDTGYVIQIEPEIVDGFEPGDQPVAAPTGEQPGGDGLGGEQPPNLGGGVRQQRDRRRGGVADLLACADHVDRERPECDQQRGRGGPASGHRPWPPPGPGKGAVPPRDVPLVHRAPHEQVVGEADQRQVRSEHGSVHQGRAAAITVGTARPHRRCAVSMTGVSAMSST